MLYEHLLSIRCRSRCYMMRGNLSLKVKIEFGILPTITKTMPSQGQTFFGNLEKIQITADTRLWFHVGGAAWWGTHPVPFLLSSPGPPWARLRCQSFSDSIALPQESPTPMPLFTSQVAKLEPGSPRFRQAHRGYIPQKVPPLCQLTCPEGKVSRDLSPDPLQTGFVKGR